MSFSWIIFNMKIRLMETSTHPALLVKCPHCGNKFAPEDAIGHEIRQQMEKEFEAKIENETTHIRETVRKQESERFKSQLRALEEDRKEKQARLKELEAYALSIEQRELRIKSREESIDIEMQKRLIEREKLIRQEAEKNANEKAALDLQEREQALLRERQNLSLLMQKKISEETEKAREEERLRAAELQKKLDDQSRLILEMKRKSEQGSMQMQGEIQELAIEDFLRTAFPKDVIEEVAKGKRGGDCIHVVKDTFDRICGKILYESKRTKHFSHDWISKLKDDMRLKQADLGVIVTETLPEGMSKFGEREGIWICTFTEFKALSFLFRYTLSRIGETLASQENRGEKMNMIYRYVTGKEFRQKLEAAFESYSEMQEDLQKEKTLLMSQWAKREKKLIRAMENLIAIYGDVRGIAGGAVQEIRALEIPQPELYQHP